MNTALEYFDKTAEKKDKNTGLQDAGIAATQTGAGAGVGALLGRTEGPFTGFARQVLTQDKNIKNTKEAKSAISILNKRRKLKGIKGAVLGTAAGGAIAAGTYALKKYNKDKEAG